MQADLVIDQAAPEFVGEGGGVRGGDAGDVVVADVVVVVADVVVVVAVVGEGCEFGGGVEGVGGGVCGGRVGAVVECVAGAGARAEAEGGVFEGDVAGAGCDGAFEVGGVVAFDAEGDGVGGGGGVGCCLGGGGADGWC